MADCRNCEMPIVEGDAVIEVRKVTEVYESGVLRTDHMHGGTHEYRHAYCKTLRSRTR